MAPVAVEKCFAADHCICFPDQKGVETKTTSTQTIFMAKAVHSNNTQPHTYHCLSSQSELWPASTRFSALSAGYTCCLWVTIGSLSCLPGARLWLDVIPYDMAQSFVILYFFYRCVQGPNRIVALVSVQCRFLRTPSVLFSGLNFIGVVRNIWTMEWRWNDVMMVAWQLVKSQIQIEPRTSISPVGSFNHSATRTPCDYLGSYTQSVVLLLRALQVVQNFRFTRS